MLRSGPTLGLGTEATPDANTGTPVDRVSEKEGARNPAAILPATLHASLSPHTAPVLQVNAFQRLSIRKSSTVNGVSASCGRGNESRWIDPSRAPAVSRNRAAACHVAIPNVSNTL